MGKKRILQVLLAVVLLLCQLVTVSATGVDQMPELEAGKKGKLTITLSYKNEKGKTVGIEGVTLEIFKAADLTVINGGAATYTLTADFAKSGVVLEGMNASESNRAAAAMENIVKTKRLKGQAAVTDENGQVVYKELEPGMYLVMQTANADTVPEYTEMESYLVSVPLGETQNGNSWNYEVNAFPKTEIGRKSEFGTIEVTKRIFIKQGEETLILEGMDTTYYVGLFRDAEGTVPYDGNYVRPIEMKGSSVAVAKFNNLKEGTYYIFETTEDGTAIQPGTKQEDFFFTFTSNFATDQKVVIDQSLGQMEGSVILDNVYEDFPDGYLKEGLIKVKKSVFQGSDRVTVDDTFYVGVFNKVDGEYVLNKVQELKQNGTVEFPVMFVGENEVDSVKYWVFETDKDGNRVDKETFPYEVSGEGIVTVAAGESEQKVEIVNTIKEIETEAPAETETEIETETENETETEKEVVKTGDETPVEAYIMLTIAALLVLVIGLVRRRSKK